MYGMLSGGHQQHTVHGGVPMFQQQQQQHHHHHHHHQSNAVVVNNNNVTSSSTFNNNNNNNNLSNLSNLSSNNFNFLKSNNVPCQSGYSTTWEECLQQHLELDSSTTAAAAGGAATTRVGLEPTSVLDLRSPSPTNNTSRALSASSSSANHTTSSVKKTAPVSSSSSSDCNNNNNSNDVTTKPPPPPPDANIHLHDAKVKSGNEHLQHHHHQQQQQRQIDSSSSLVHSSPSTDEQLQEELEQAVAAAAAGAYGVLPLVYSSQGIRHMDNNSLVNVENNNNTSSGGGGGGDQWLLQDVVVAAHQHDQAKLEELESVLLSTCPSPANAGVAAAAATGVPPDINSAASFMWLLEETGGGSGGGVAPPPPSVSSSSSVTAAPGGEVEVLLPPPWQQQHHHHQLQQQQQMMMMMVKQEPQHQQQLTSSLPPHFAHLESFTRRTLPLVSSAPDMFHAPPPPPPPPAPQFHQDINLLWQHQQMQMQQQQRDPFMLGMLQDEHPPPQQRQHHHHHLSSLFGAPQAPGFLPQRPHHQHHHTGYFMENLSPPPPPLHLLQQQQHQLHGGVKHQQHQQQQRRTFHDEGAFKSTMQSHKRDHVQLQGNHHPSSGQQQQQQQQHYDVGHSSSKVARTSSSGQLPADDVNWCTSSPSSSEAFVLLLHAAEACENGQDDIAQSILARLNDHHHQHHQVFLQRQQQHHSQKQQNYVPAPSHRIGLLFRDVLMDRLKRKLVATDNTSLVAPSAAEQEHVEIVDRIEACKNLCESSKLMRFAHFIANQAIYEAIENEECVHILDLSEAGNTSSSNTSFGGQWSSFIASAQKHPKPMKIRLTLTSPRRHALLFAITNLKELARDYSNAGGVEFDIHGVLTQPGSPLTLADMGISSDENLIVNLVLGLHKLVPCSRVLEAIRSSSPKLLVLIEQELDLKPAFLGRFKEGLQYYTTLAESVSSEEWTAEDSEKVEQLIWKPEIEELLSGNLEHQRLEQWKLKMAQARMCSVKLSDMCEKLAHNLFTFDRNSPSSSNTNRGFELVREEEGLLLSFRGKLLASASAWKCC